MKRWKRGSRLKLFTKISTKTLLTTLLLSTKLSHARRDSEPVFVEDPRSQTVEDMSSVALTCRANGTPEPVITWHKKNKRTRSWQKLTSEIVDGTAHVFEGDLDFLSVSKGGRRTKNHSDDGEYRCVATNSMGSVHSQSAKLTVAWIGNKFQLEPSKLYNAQLGTRVKLECNPPKGFPEPKVSWLHDGTDINELEALNIDRFIENNNNRIIDGEGNLIIYKVSHQDAGNWICQARIRDVPEGETSTKRSNESKLMVSEKVRLTMKPPADFTILEGITPKLECKATGSPPPKIQWFYQASRSAPQRSVTKPSKSTPSITPARTGIYTCVANNTNKSRDSAQVRVQRASKPKKCDGRHAVPTALNLNLINSRVTSLDRFLYDTVLRKNWSGKIGENASFTNVKNYYGTTDAKIQNELNTAHCVSINKYGEFKEDETLSKKQNLMSSGVFSEFPYSKIQDSKTEHSKSSMETSFTKLEKLLPPVLKTNTKVIGMNRSIDCQLANKNQVFKTNRLSFLWRFSVDGGNTWALTSTQPTFFKLSALITESARQGQIKGQKLGERLTLETAFKSKFGEFRDVFVSCTVRKLPDFSDEGPHLLASQKTRIATAAASTLISPAPTNSKLEYHHESNKGKLMIYAAAAETGKNSEISSYTANTEYVLKFLQTSFENKYATPELSWRTLRSRGKPVWSIKIQNFTQFPILAGYYSAVFNASAVTEPTRLSYFYLSNEHLPYTDCNDERSLTQYYPIPSETCSPTSSEVFLDVINDCTLRESNERKFVKILQENIQNGCDYVKIERAYRADKGAHSFLSSQLVSNPVVMQYTKGTGLASGKSSYTRKSGYFDIDVLNAKYYETETNYITIQSEILLKSQRSETNFSRILDIVVKWRSSRYANNAIESYKTIKFEQNGKSGNTTKLELFFTIPKSDSTPQKLAVAVNLIEGRTKYSDFKAVKKVKFPGKSGNSNTDRYVLNSKVLTQISVIKEVDFCPDNNNYIMCVITKQPLVSIIILSTIILLFATISSFAICKCYSSMRSDGKASFGNTEPASVADFHMPGQFLHHTTANQHHPLLGNAEFTGFLVGQQGQQKLTNTSGLTDSGHDTTSTSKSYPDLVNAQNSEQINLARNIGQIGQNSGQLVPHPNLGHVHPHVQQQFQNQQQFQPNQHFQSNQIQNQLQNNADSPTRNLFMANLPQPPKLPRQKHQSGDNINAQLFPMILQQNYPEHNNYLQISENSSSPGRHSGNLQHSNLQISMIPPIDSGCREASTDHFSNNIPSHNNNISEQQYLGAAIGQPPKYASKKSVTPQHVAALSSAVSTPAKHYYNSENSSDLQQHNDNSTSSSSNKEFQNRQNYARVLPAPRMGCKQQF